MKKLDLHIHTISTNMDDKKIEFDMEDLKEYVIQNKINAIAITNHNIFDLEQYYEISAQLVDICYVFPGIEITLKEEKKGHMLCIANKEDINDFVLKCMKIQEKIQEKEDYVSTAELKKIFTNMNNYLWIPHINKNPQVDKKVLDIMDAYIFCGEVGSVKKFMYALKDKKALTPVYFSDYRPHKKDLAEKSLFPTRFTFFDIEQINLNSIKLCLRDKNKVALSESEGNKIFNILPDLKISTGLNVVLGERSSGKSYLLNEISKTYENIKYIKQFELIENDSKSAIEGFDKQFSTKRGDKSEEYLREFKNVVDDVKNIFLESEEKKIDNYINSLLKKANELDRADMYSKCTIYSEGSFDIYNLDTLKELISAVEKLINACEYQTIIKKYLSEDDLKNLVIDLIQEYKTKEINIKKRQWVNELIQQIKEDLRLRTSDTFIEEVNFYDYLIDKNKVIKFNEIVNELQKDCKIQEEKFSGFKIVLKRDSFKNASELKNKSEKRDVSFSKIIDQYYENPYKYLMGLRNMDSIKESEYYKFFSKIEYNILNQYNIPISGGEKAEFNLLQKINDSNNYEMLLIDEPESSFDNIFLKNEVNNLIKIISKSMPVIIVTHNSTMGMSIKPDYIIHTKRDISQTKEIKYRRYYGRPTDKKLYTYKNETIDNIEVILDCLEAGNEAYKERGVDYEILKN